MSDLRYEDKVKLFQLHYYDLDEVPDESTKQWKTQHWIDFIDEHGEWYTDELNQ